MNILTKILPIILISIVFYLFIYNVYPKYQDVLSAVKKINELKNQEKEIDLNIKLIQSLNQNQNIQQLLNNKTLLNAWLPLRPNIEEIIYFIAFNFQNLGLNLGSIDFKIEEENLKFNENVLPVGVLVISLNGNFADRANEVIKLIESSARILKIKSVKLNKAGKADIEVESYYLLKNFEKQ